MEAAHDLFVERDYDLVSTEEILERPGVSRGALYHHFPTKLDLFRAVFEASERRVIGSRSRLRCQPACTPFEALVHLARGYLRAAETDEELRRIGLGQSRAVLGWEGWREACSRTGDRPRHRRCHRRDRGGRTAAPRPRDASRCVMLGTMIEAAMLIVVAEDRSAAARRTLEAVIVDLLEGLRR